jgi:hypothetical protein
VTKRRIKRRRSRRKRMKMKENDRLVLRDSTSLTG